MDAIDESTPVNLLTVGQLFRLLNPKEQTPTPINSNKVNANLIYGVEALSKFINCSIPTARKLIKGGRIRYVRDGRQYIFDRETILFKLGNTQNV